MEYEEVDYWDEICSIMEWSKTHAFSTLHLCWGAQAGLYYHYGIPKRVLPKKRFGVYAHHVKNRKSHLSEASMMCFTHHTQGIPRS